MAYEHCKLQRHKLDFKSVAEDLKAIKKGKKCYLVAYRIELATDVTGYRNFVVAYILEANVEVLLNR